MRTKRAWLKEPVVGGRKISAHVAQLVEHVLGKDEVSGSIPLVGSSRNTHGEIRGSAGRVEDINRREVGRTEAGRHKACQ